ncbi:hypothetical protein KR222_003823, partial [Zaprionus bogoriensis]
VPRFHKDDMGNWVYHAWQATYGKVWHDTRFNVDNRHTIPHMAIDSNPVTYYFPTGTKETVCQSASTLYNRPKVRAYLRRNVYLNPHKELPIWNELRLQIYKQGNSEECHSLDYIDKTGLEYQECAIRRNQRLEYLIPKYPLHQVGYRGT